jgi:hypothetical protein
MSTSRACQNRRGGNGESVVRSAHVSRPDRPEGYGFTGPAGGFFGVSVLFPLAFHSFSGQNVAVV